VFTPVETQDTNGKTLDTPTKAQQDLVAKLDTPKYVGGQGSGSIPFISTETSTPAVARHTIRLS